MFLHVRVHQSYRCGRCTAGPAVGIANTCRVNPTIRTVSISRSAAATCHNHPTHRDSSRSRGHDISPRGVFRPKEQHGGCQNPSRAAACAFQEAGFESADTFNPMSLCQEADISFGSVVIRSLSRKPRQLLIEHARISHRVCARTVAPRSNSPPNCVCFWILPG